MAETTIEWTRGPAGELGYTFNGWIGCTKVSPGCDNCYAAAQDNHRKWTPAGWGAGKPRRLTSDDNWDKPTRWNAAAAKAGERRRVFCSSLADVFDNEVDATWRADLFELIAATPHLDWLLLTKRIGNAHRMIEAAVDALDEKRARDATKVVRGPWPWPNVWLGATIVNQEEADRDIPKLLATPARVRFLSMEPLLGPVDLRKHLRPWPGYCQTCGSELTPPDSTSCSSCGCSDHDEGYGRRQRFVRPDWIIAGGESGPKARPSHPDWFRDLRDQCAAASVPFLFKQWGEWASTWHARIDPALAEGKPYVHVTPMCRENGTNMSAPNYQLDRVGKKAAGRLLDGVEHNGFPEVAA